MFVFFLFYSHNSNAKIAHSIGKTADFFRNIGEKLSTYPDFLSGTPFRIHRQGPASRRIPDLPFRRFRTITPVRLLFRSPEHFVVITVAAVDIRYVVDQQMRRGDRLHPIFLFVIDLIAEVPHLEHSRILVVFPTPFVIEIALFGHESAIRIKSPPLHGVSDYIRRRLINIEPVAQVLPVGLQLLPYLDFP